MRRLLKISLDLPCGHVLTHAAGVEHDQYDLDSAFPVLQYWFKDRAKRHDCALVTASNPNGIRPKK